MREIEFRGKILFDNEQGKWITGDLEHFTASDGREMVRIRPEGKHKEFVIPKTIGQYTGLKDKHGVEIYEGDVLHISIENRVISNYPQHDLTKTGVVKYSEENTRFAIFTESKTGDSFIICKDCELEVIGNIFDDPELDKQFGEVYRKEQ